MDITIEQENKVKDPVRIIDLPYFNDWYLWLWVEDMAGSNPRRYIANVVYKYLHNKYNVEPFTAKKKVWDTLQECATKEGLTVPALIESICCQEMNICRNTQLKEVITPQDVVNAIDDRDIALAKQARIEQQQGTVAENIGNTQPVSKGYTIDVPWARK